MISKIKIVLCAVVSISIASILYFKIHQKKELIIPQPITTACPQQEPITPLQPEPLHVEHKKFISGNKKVGFESITCTTPLQELQYQGTMPSWLQGALLATGPALFELGKTKASYSFNGLALLHGFYFDGKTVRYHNAFLDSVYYQRCQKNGKFDSSMSTEKPKGFFSRLAAAAFSTPEPYDNGNLGLAKINNNFIALTETTLGVVFDPLTLKTIKPFDINKSIEGHLTTAQFQYDPTTKAWYNYMINFGTTSSYSIYKIGSDNIPKEIANLPVKTPAYMRSFAMTKDYIILVEIPFVVNPFDLMLGAGAFVEKVQWKPELGTKFIIINKYTGQHVGTLATPTPFLNFNIAHAWQDNKNIIIDAPTYPDSHVIARTKLDALHSNDPREFDSAYVTRFILNLDKNTVTYKKVSEQSLDFPVVNEALVAMAPYTYVYGIGAQEPYKFPESLVKINVQSGKAQTWSEDGCYATKPAFVPAPHAKQEDEGVLLSVVLNSITKRSFLLILDAQTFIELGRAEIPVAIPLGLAPLFSPSK